MTRATQSLFAITLTLTGCYTTTPPGSNVHAINTRTGEERNFASRGDVPPDFAICDPECPPLVICEQLRPDECGVRDDCDAVPILASARRPSGAQEPAIIEPGPPPPDGPPVYTCVTPDPQPIDCACPEIAPAIGIVCPDGQSGTYVCEVNVDGTCQLAHVCEPIVVCWDPPAGNEPGVPDGDAPAEEGGSEPGSAGAAPAPFPHPSDEPVPMPPGCVIDPEPTPLPEPTDPPSSGPREPHAA